MDVVRRLYLYAMSAVSLGVLWYGLQVLLMVLLRAVGLGGVVIGGDPDNERRALSLAISLVGVGLPVWAVHWFLVERSLNRARPTAEAERRSALRALYLSAVLAALIVLGAAAGADLIRQVVHRILPDVELYLGDAAGSLATLVVSAAAWALHAWARRRDAALGELRGAAAWWPRAYRYALAFVGVALLLEGVGALLALGVDALTGSGVPGAGSDPSFTDSYGFRLAQALPNVVIGLVAWASHAWASDRLAAEVDWRGDSERRSRLRLGYWPIVFGVAAVAVILHANEGLRPLLGRLLGVRSDFFQPLDDLGLVAAVARAMGAALPWIVAWWLHRRWSRAEAAASGEPAAAVLLDRLERHVVAATGLAFSAVGAGWIVGLAIDVLLGGNRATIPDGGWRYELAGFLSLAVLGLPLWVWNWSRLIARRGGDPSEAASPVRRAYLLLVVAVAILSSLGGLAIVLYRLVAFLLGAEVPGNAVSELSTPVGALAVALAVVVYHGLALRADQAVRAPELTTPTVPPIEVGPAAAAADEDASATAEPAVRRTLVLTAAADADIGETLAALRGALPEGQSLDEA